MAVASFAYGAPEKGKESSKCGRKVFRKAPLTLFLPSRPPVKSLVRYIFLQVRASSYHQGLEQSWQYWGKLLPKVFFAR